MSIFLIAGSFESEPDLVPPFHTLKLLEAMHEYEMYVLVVVLIRSEHIVHLAKKMAMHQYWLLELTCAQDMSGTYVVHDGLATLLRRYDFLKVAMKFFASRIDDPPPTQNGRLFADHVYRRIISKFLPLIKLGIDALVVLARVLVGPDEEGRCQRGLVRHVADLNVENCGIFLGLGCGCPTRPAGEFRRGAKHPLTTATIKTGAGVPYILLSSKIKRVLLKHTSVV
jgi:hypothetical protein